MARWEYRTFEQFRSTKGIFGLEFRDWMPQIDLAGLGQEGWELISITPVSSGLGLGNSGCTTELVWVFKRETG
jgi:hypothetical protein